MRSLSNLARKIIWKIRRKLDLPKQTISPIQWKSPIDVKGPSLTFVKNIPEEQQEKLRYLQRETKLFSQLTRFFPNKITDSDWNTLLKCATRKERLDHLIFLRKREQLRENEKEKQLVEKTKRAALKVEIASENWLFNFNMGRIESFERQIEWSRVARSYQLDGPKIAVDCRFLSMLSPRGADLTGIQLQHLVSHNKQKRQPWPLYFVNFDTSLDKVAELQKKHLSVCTSNYSSGPIVTRENYVSLGAKSKIIYLSPHAEEDISEIEEDGIYVIGGIVDRVPEKGIHPHASKVTAEEDGVRCLRLPLEKFVKWESGHKFLTLLAVMNIIQDAYRCNNDWAYACQRHIPIRNIRPPEEKNQLMRTKHEQIREFNRQILQIVDTRIGSKF